MRVSKLKIKSMLMGLAITMSWTTVALSEATHDGHAAHGFVVFGKQQQFIYHLAKYNSPHSFFGVGQGELLNEDGTNVSLPTPKKGIYSVLSTEHSVITELFRPQVDGFQVEVFDGYLRSDDKVSLGKKYYYRIKKTFSTQVISPDSFRPYYKKFLILKENENWSYLVHWLSGAPNYEQILRVFSQDADNIVTGDSGMIWRVSDTAAPFKKFESSELLVRLSPKPLGFHFDVIDVLMEEHKTLQQPPQSSGDEAIGRAFYNQPCPDDQGFRDQLKIEAMSHLKSILDDRRAACSSAGGIMSVGKLNEVIIYERSGCEYKVKTEAKCLTNP